MNSNPDKFYKIVADFTSGFVNANSSNFDNKIQSMLSGLVEVLELDRAYFFDISPDSRYMSNTHEYCGEGVPPVIENMQNMSLKRFSWWHKKLESLDFISIEDVSKLGHEALNEKEFLTGQGIKSLVAIPVKEDGRVTGFLGLETITTKRVWKEDIINLLTILVNTVNETKCKIRGEEELERMGKMQSILLNIAKVYINIPFHQLHSTVMNSLKEMAEFVGADRSYIFDYDFTKKITVNTYEWCATGIQPQIDNLKEVPLQYLSEWISRHEKGEAYIIPDVAQLPYDGPTGVRGLLEPQQVKSIITVPMTDDNHLVGFVGFDSVRSHHIYSEKEKSLLFFFAQMVTNVKKRAGYEKTLSQAREIAEEASRAKTEFLTNMSHEIRTPLNSVIGFTELLNKTPLNISQKKFVESANLSAQSLLEIINDILDLSKIEAGKLELLPAKSDIIELCEYVCDIVKYQAMQKEIELLLNINPSMPRFAVVDPVRIKQVLVNLLSNAVKFTHQGEVELKVSYTRSGENRGNFTFEVRDTGIGISQEDQRKLFKAFSQADSSTTRKYGGTGLGLVISNHLVEQMGGNIQLQSLLGQGSKFYFSIETETDDSIKDFNPKELNVSRVLIVDDNLNNRQILDYALKNWNIETTLCEDGLEAIRLFKISKPFDVIIIDYKMPLINGLDTIRMLRSDASFAKEKQPVIIMSSSDNDTLIADEMKHNGLLHRINKPVKLKDLYNYLLNLSKTGELPPQPKRTPHKAAIEKLSNEELSHFTRNKLIDKPVIMIAEDVQMNMILMRTLIKNYLPDAVVYEAYNGMEAVSSALQHNPDLIFMDVQMPVMDGLLATRQIRKSEIASGGRSTIIALTAGATGEDKQRCDDAGMDHYLTKPINQRELQKVLSKYLYKGEDARDQTAEIPTIQPKATIHEIRNPEKHFNRAEMLKRVDNDQEIMTDLFNSLEAEMEESIAELESDMVNSRMDNIKKIAHKIKGVALNMSFDNLSLLAKQLESAAAANDPSSALILSKVKDEWVIIKILIYPDNQ